MLYFIFKLAREQCKTVKQLIRELDVDELRMQLAFNELNPFGYERTDLNAAMICTVLANVNGNKKELKDFIPRFLNEPVKPKDPQVLSRELWNYFSMKAEEQRK